MILPIILITGGAALMRILDNTIDKGGEEPPVLPFLTDMYIDDGQVLDIALGNHPTVGQYGERESEGGGGMSGRAWERHRERERNN